jgi:hypothetical protein
MTERPDDLVRVTTGEVTAIQVLGNALTEAGIQSNVVGGDLTAGIGSAMPDPAELWVHRRDLALAEKAIAGHRPHGFQPASHPVAGHGHPTDDPKPDHAKGPSHGTPHHRPFGPDGR